ncbi:MAG: UDP-N-acetylmuramate dehydrogenase [Rhodospirillaceae bacterium]|nr:UDP-N-acetylmuramate dehydrogenase [Rhodospirillaceae bacterium]MBT3927475.1 UDP-N-acetylmuramate dehydrogenase [Rhodospirillaceae bacterium]MBT5674802.1 UDP-N-acetylmuramate dehydrogenase [Rhodospirillaceae bacterium]MBT5778471.1 UDP-N-acetylmuramate dehydrogenase [Rhodospirillaceae bacterium]MBT6828737.1 UDP-N-acetylmuramate dehydrogenase [Rhodospirillaceae bacterium]
MAAPRQGLIERLPKVRGEYIADAPLAPIAWFRVGGAAETLYRPADADDLAGFLANKPRDIPITLFGSGSNVLVRDGGIPGVVIRLTSAFRQSRIEWQGDSAHVHVGAGAADITVARLCRDSGVGGLEFLVGVPGTIGGALRMNAGAYGREMAHVMLQAEAFDFLGARQRLSPQNMGFSYRHSNAPDDWIFVSAILQGHREDPETIAKAMAEIESNREDSQPLRTRTGGSTFTNPPGMKAWQLIDQAGCRGLRRGGAIVSEKHCNFLINTGGASAADLEGLGEEVRRRVKQETGVTLEWEIRRIGRHGTGQASLGGLEGGDS